MKTTRKSLAIVLALSMIFALGAFSAGAANDLTIRVNGRVVTFPDAQPYVNSDSRTMIPVRFVAEALGADVFWDGKLQCAVAEKNGIRVEIPIGSRDLRVIKNGKTEIVKMDTAAALKENRTFVPIRFVAEALGAYVDYSGYYGKVGIYNDVLTADEIAMLRAFDYTQPEYAISYAEAKERFDADDLVFCYGTGRESFVEYANAREHLYGIGRRGKYYLADKPMNVDSAEDFYILVVEAARECVNYSSERVTVEFITDTSCIYQSDSMDDLTTAVRGIAKVRLSVVPTMLEGYETAKLVELGFTQLYADVDMYIPVDVHMNSLIGHKLDVHTIVPLGEATK